MLVLCSGMFRSGSTLQYNLARSIAEASGVGRGAGWKDQDGSAPPRDELARLAAAPEMTVLKSHDVLGLEDHPLPEAVEGSPTDVRVCYSYRDLRDVGGSAKSHWNLTDDKLLEMIREALKAYEAVQTMPRVLVQSYEKLTKSTPDAAQELSAFLGVSLSDAQLAEIAERWSLESVASSAATKPRHVVDASRKVLTAVGLGAPARAVKRMLPAGLHDKLFGAHRDDSLLHPGHVGKLTQQGRLSRELLSDAELAAIEEVGGAWMREHGYA